MEKKHRDIVVDGQQYGWIVNFQGREQYVTVYKDKKKLFTKMTRLPEITPSLISEFIQEYNEQIRVIELNETLDKEWTAFLSKVPWDGYGRTIAESNRIFETKRKAWMFRMTKKHDVSISVLSERYVHDKK
jgi:hypothetical protein